MWFSSANLNYVNRLYAWEGSRYVCHAAEGRTGGFQKMISKHSLHEAGMFLLGCAPRRRRERRQIFYQILSNFLNTICKLFYPINFWIWFLTVFTNRVLSKYISIIYGKNCNYLGVCYYVGLGSWDVQNNDKQDFFKTSAVAYPGL